MREIIFRGKRTDNGEWVEGAYYKQTLYYGDPCEKHYIITSTESLGYDRALEYYEVDPETVGECVNIPDENGVMIFEGDFVQICEEVKTCFGLKDGAVEYHKGNFLIKGNNEGLIASLLALVDIYYVMRGRIIGNIHDNPELLKGGVQE